MSAYVMNDMELGSIAKSIFPGKDTLSYGLAQSLANRLKAINVSSVNYRYNDKARKIKCNMKHAVILPNDVLKQYIECWDYQACENQSDIDYHIICGFLFGYLSSIGISCD